MLQNNTFDYHKLPFIIKIFVLSIFEWPFYTFYSTHNIKRYIASNDDGSVIIKKISAMKCCLCQAGIKPQSWEH